MNRKYKLFLTAFVFSILAIGCQPDEEGLGNGLTNADVTADFTITQLDQEPNRFLLSNEGSSVLRYFWSVGEGFYEGSATDTIFLPDAGEYTLSHRVIDRGGATSTNTQELNVPTSDPIAGNIVQGGRFEDEEAWQEWTILNISESGASWNFNDGFATLNASNFSQQGIFQEVTVEAGVPYTIDMRVFGSGTTDTWFEVYAAPSPPVQFSEYTDGGIRAGFSSFHEGCATSEFDGPLSDIDCLDTEDTVTFDQSGTIYLVIRSGGQNTGTTGVSVTSVEMRRVVEE